MNKTVPFKENEGKGRGWNRLEWGKDKFSLLS